MKLCLKRFISFDKNTKYFNRGKLNFLGAKKLKNMFLCCKTSAKTVFQLHCMNTCIQEADAVNAVYITPTKITRETDPASYADLNSA